MYRCLLLKELYVSFTVLALAAVYWRVEFSIWFSFLYASFSITSFSYWSQYALSSRPSRHFLIRSHCSMSALKKWLLRGWIINLSNCNHFNSGKSFCPTFITLTTWALLFMFIYWLQHTVFCLLRNWYYEIIKGGLGCQCMSFVSVN